MTLPFGLGTLRVAAPAVLLALLALPLLLAGRRRTREVLPAAACRALAAAAVVLTLAGLHLERAVPAAGTCVVAAIDVSASVQHAAAARAARFLDALLPAFGPDDLVGSLAFAARARVVARPAVRPRRAADLLPPRDESPTGLETGDTDLAAALAAALPLCPEGKQAAVLLFTDGHETEGSVLAEAALAGSRVPVFPVVPRVADLPPAAIRRVLAPAFAPEHGVLPLEVVVESRAEAPIAAAIALTANGDPLAHTPVTLAPGLSVVSLPYRLVGAGHYLLEAELRLPEGGPPAPGPARAALTVTPPLRVLVASEREMPVAAAALAERGMQVEIVTPAGLAARRARLADWHVVVLDNLGRAHLDEPLLEALAARVAAGGGLVVAGDEHLFGDPALAGSALARILPVELRSRAPRPQEREPIALYLVIDRSNSMGYASGRPMLQNAEKMTYAKRAALAVLDQLGPRDLVGAIAFDSLPHELGPLLPARESRAELAARIRQLQHGGGTDFKEALDIARRNLVASGRIVRHVILLTDGDTNRSAEDHAPLIAGLTRAEITVTTIRVGADTINLDLLEAISRATGGEFHHVEDVRALPQLMIRDARRLLREGAEGRHLRPRRGEAGAVLAGIGEEELPPVERWAPTRPRPGAEVRLYLEAGEERDPLLATWQYELGRVAALPLDFQAGAAEWAVWTGFGKLWTQLVRWAAPVALPSDRHLEVERTRAGTRVRLRTVADDEGPFALRLPGAGEVPLRPTGPRTFDALVPSLRAGRHSAVLAAGRAEESLVFMVPATAASGREHRAGAPNRALLEEVARATGGAVDPEPAAILTARPGVARRRVPLEPWLVPFALALVLADVALRLRARP